MSARLLTIVGARPQFIKAATVSRAIHAHNAEVQATGQDQLVEELIVHTGQHFDANMSDVFFEQLDIPLPRYHLGIDSVSHGAMTGRMLEAIEACILNERPDWVLVYGDTNSTLAGALAAVKLHVPLAHVEAGLRSFNRRMPEEINRVLTDHAADLLFTPTETASRNLAKEGITEAKVQQVGDVMYDAALFYGKLAEKNSSILAQLDLAPQSYILATLHRAENTDDAERLQSILAGFAQASQPIIWPLHPRTRKRLLECSLTLPSNVRLIAPVGYLDMVMLEKHAALIATDSGGVQKEAYFHAVPCLTLRDETEWVETVEAGWNLVVGADATSIAGALHQHPATGLTRLTSSGAYGDGQAAYKILRHLTAS